MSKRFKLTSVPKETNQTDELIFEMLRGDVDSVVFQNPSDVETLLEVAQNQGTTPLLVEAFGCHVVALSNNEDVTKRLHQSGISRVATSPQQALEILLQRHNSEMLESDAFESEVFS